MISTPVRRGRLCRGQKLNTTFKVGITGKKIKRFLPSTKTDFGNTCSPVLRQNLQGGTPTLLLCALGCFPAAVRNGNDPVYGTPRLKLHVCREDSIMNTPFSDSAVQLRNEQEAHVLSGQETHVVQLYSDDNLLLDALCRFIGGAIAVGDAGVVIATKAHHDGLAVRLKARGLDTAKAISQGRYVSGGRRGTSTAHYGERPSGRDAFHGDHR